MVVYVVWLAAERTSWAVVEQEVDDMFSPYDHRRPRPSSSLTFRRQDALVELVVTFLDKAIFLVWEELRWMVDLYTIVVYSIMFPPRMDLLSKTRLKADMTSPVRKG